MAKFIPMLGISAAALILGMTPAAFAASHKHVVPVPVVVAAPVTPSIGDGYVSLGVGNATFSSDDDFLGPSQSFGGLSLTGRATGEYNFTSVLGFQGDIVLASQRYDISGESYTVTDRSLDLALHGFYREEGSFLLGGFFQYGTDSAVEESSPISFSYDRYYGGAEAQLFLGDATLYGQLGVQQYDIAGYQNNGYFGNFEARYFLQPNLKLDAHVGFNNLNDDAPPAGSLRTWNVGVGAEYRLDASPISFFAKYDHVNFSSDVSSGSLNDNRFLVGAKFNLGTDTLEQRDHSGASLDPVQSPSLPFFGFGG